MQHKKEWHEVNGDQHQGKDGHKIAVRLNLKCVPRRRRQETEPKGINEIKKTEHVPRRNKTCGLLRRSRISKTHNGCREAYEDVADARQRGEAAFRLQRGSEKSHQAREKLARLPATAGAPHGGRALPVPLSLGRNASTSRDSYFIGG